MAAKGYPAIPANIWWKLRERFVNAPPKGEVTKEYLSSALGLGAKVAANVMPAIKQVGLIDDSNLLTPLARRWRDDQTYAEACREIIDSAYPDSLKDVSPPDNPDLAAAARWFLNETGAGAPRARVLAVFYALIAKGELNGAAERVSTDGQARAPRRDSTEAATQRSRERVERASSDKRGPNHAPDPTPPTLSVAIQIYIDKDMSAANVDQVFASMAKHLYGRG
jgi:hypothetical protein